MLAAYSAPEGFSRRGMQLVPPFDDHDNMPPLSAMIRTGSLDRRHEAWNPRGRRPEVECYGAQFDSPRSACGGAVSERSYAPSQCRSEAETIASQAMSSWLDGDSLANVPSLAPIEMAEWLRTLPSGKLSDEVRKTIARRVLEDDLDSRRFGQLLAQDGGWTSLGVSDERDAKTLERFFKTRQREAALAAAARESGAVNRQLKGMKGEALTV